MTKPKRFMELYFLIYNYVRESVVSLNADLIFHVHIWTGCTLYMKFILDVLGFVLYLIGRDVHFPCVESHLNSGNRKCMKSGSLLDQMR